VVLRTISARIFLLKTHLLSNQHTVLQILIRNLDRKLTETDVLDLFRKYGNVKSCSLVMDNKTGLSKGFGFVEMPNLDEAGKAVSELNGKKIGSSAIRVKRAANSSVMKKRN